MGNIRRRRHVGVLGVAALGTALLTFGIGAPTAQAIDTHPCLPGERDMIGEIEFAGGGRVFWVAFCVDGNDPPTPSLPWGSASVGHPCESGETDGTHKVRGYIEDYGDVTIWFCDDAQEAVPPPPPPPPGSTRSVRQFNPKDYDAVLTPTGTPSRFVPIAPTRALDTRAPGGRRLAIGEARVIDLAAILPADATAAAVNITATDATTAGYLSAWDCASTPPQTSVVNVRAGGTAAAATIVNVDAARRLCVTGSVDTHLLLDVGGAFVRGAGDGYRALTPRRIHDSRPVVVDAGSTTRVSVAAPGQTQTAAFLNVTAVAPDADGYLTVWPCSQARPEVSNLNFTAGISAIANAAVVATDPDGSLCVYNSAAAGVLVDLFGVFDPAPSAASYQPVVPVRILDTRDGTGFWKGTLGNGQTIYVRMNTDATGLLGTVTAVEPPQEGFLTVVGTASASGAAPSYSTLNVTDTTIANMFTSVLINTVSISAGPTAGAHVLLDVTGYFVAPSG